MRTISLRSAQTHRWVVSIDGQNSTVSTTNYNRPQITSIEGMVDASNDGYEEVVVRGKDFGGDVNKLEQVSYGPTGTEFNALDCTVAAHVHDEIRCKTSPGMGGGLKWSVKVDGQTSDLSDFTTNYKSPVIDEIVLDVGETQGQSEHVINGTNLAVNVPGSYIEVLFDNERIVLSNDGFNNEGSKRIVAGSYMSGRVGDKDFVRFVLPHLSVLPQMKVVKVRVGHVEKLNVEQLSNELGFEYGTPEVVTIENIEGNPIMNPAGTAVDQPTTDLVVRGNNFGLAGYSDLTINDELQSVTMWR